MRYEVSGKVGGIKLLQTFEQGEDTDDMRSHYMQSRFFVLFFDGFHNLAMLVEYDFHLIDPRHGDQHAGAEIIEVRFGEVIPDAAAMTAIENSLMQYFVQLEQGGII